MDRIINVSVGGNYLKKDNKNAGVRGEANVTMLRIAFDEGWDNFAKTVTFLDARGLNPVNVMLGVNLLEDRRVYLVPIPAEPMAVAGWLTFIVEGALNNKVQRSFADKLEVKDAPDTDDAVNAVDPVPSEVEQFQTEIEYIKDNIHDAVEANKAIQNMSVSAVTLKAGEQAFVKKTEKDGVVNLHYGLPAGGKGDKGEKGDSGKSAYEIALSKGFKGTEEEWVDWLRNGVDGKDGNPGVYVGTGEMPDGYSVQIDPSGNDTAVFSEIAQTTGNSESAVMSQKATTDAIRTAEAIAKGRSSGYVFDTESDMEAWCSPNYHFVNYYSRSPYLGALEGEYIAIVVDTPGVFVPYGDWNISDGAIFWVLSTKKFYQLSSDVDGLVEMSPQPIKTASFTLIENVDPPSVGDSLYIRDTAVPDYWWDGSEPQPLETKFVDVDQYVKKTELDYAVKMGLTDVKGTTWSDAEKKAAQDTLGITDALTKALDERLEEIENGSY